MTKTKERTNKQTNTTAMKINPVIPGTLVPLKAFTKTYNEQEQELNHSLLEEIGGAT